MRKQIKKWGDSAIIVFSKEDLKGYDLEIGDFVDIGDIVKIKLKSKRKNKQAKKDKSKQGNKGNEKGKI